MVSEAGGKPEKYVVLEAKWNVSWRREWSAMASAADEPSRMRTEM